ncbi:hypothetical protein [Paraburkholderia domus]|uniref:hypothetical protein n=1 Tax=Paraburkholderia domus TaxID=2793075 RepID=UPI001911EA9E|nr:hypothetical protein [Paraburkholderia domus]MBK5065704.1 hypothetical protein [Burkholderia sp. R-70199]
MREPFSAPKFRLLDGDATAEPMLLPTHGPNQIVFGAEKTTSDVALHASPHSRLA